MYNKIECFCHSRVSIIDKNRLAEVCESYDMLALSIYFVLFIKNSPTFQEK